MTFGKFCLHLAKIEATAKRLEMTSLLSELLKQADSREIDKLVMLSLGRLTPLYKDIDFGLAEKTIIRSLTSVNGVEAATVLEIFKKLGDLGEVAFKLKAPAFASRSSRRTGLTERSSAGRQISKLSVNDVYDRLLSIAKETGEGSQERKLEKTARLLRELDPLGAKYAVRIILGNLRLGFSDKTVLDALSVMITGDKSARDKLEAAYNVRPDVGWLTKQVKSQIARRDKKEVEKLEWIEKEKGKGKFLSISVAPQLGVPILPALCQRLAAAEEIIEKMRRVAVEPKWDGQRIQAHLSLNSKLEIRNHKSKMAEVNLFTRSLEDVTEMFPDLVKALRTLIQYSVFSIQNCILDGEVVGVDPKTEKVLPFQTMITRKRKYGIQEKLADVPVRYMVFDILYLNGKSLMNEQFSKRREILEKLLGKTVEPYNSKTVIGKSVTGNPVRRYTDLPSYRSTDYCSTASPFHRNPVVNLAPQLITTDPVSIRKFLKQQIAAGLEGIVAKRTDAPYIPGRTQFAWVKLKWEGAAKSGGLVDTVDCVVMGTYAGRGKRAGFGVGAFLVGILSNLSNLSNLRYLTISKIGTGLTDEQWKELKVKSEKLKVKSCPKEYDVPKELTPDIWLKPELVVEIQADNITKSPLHTAGYALRFPRLVKYRGDKRPEQATTIGEIKKLYEMQ